jgi:UDP-3-O-[3-hydroxymyristoyl] glucosamine N-acyltransferase
MVNMSNILNVVSGKYIGPDEMAINGGAGLSDAQEGDISFCGKADGAYALLQTTKASVVIVPENQDIPETCDVPYIVVKNPRLAFVLVMQKFFTPQSTFEIHPTAVIADNVEMGEGCIIHPNVTICSNVKIGNNVVIHSGCVIGGDGFGFERDDNNVPQKFPHIGGVVLGDNVEIQSLTHVAKGTLGNTVIGTDTKIDGRCHIAHNVQIGDRCLVTAGVMIAGSVVVGDDVYIAPSASIINKVKIGDDAFVGIASLVTKDVGAGIAVAGSPARVIRR